MFERLFYDTESGSIISGKDLYEEFLQLSASRGTDAETFPVYISNCTGKNGTLEEVRK